MEPPIIEPPEKPGPIIVPQVPIPIPGTGPSMGPVGWDLLQQQKHTVMQITRNRNSPIADHITVSPSNPKILSTPNMDLPAAAVSSSSSVEPSLSAASGDSGVEESV